MYNLYNSDSIEQGFCNYLKSLGLTKNSIRFYKSDLSHFARWVLAKIKSLGASAQNLKESVPFLNPAVTGQYKNYLNADEAPRSYDRGIFSPLLRRERNPSEAENSSHSSTGLRPRFSAKGDKTCLLLAKTMAR